MNYKYIKFLGSYQIVGGIIGILAVLYKLNSIHLTSTIFFTFSIYCGFLLLRKQYVKGLNLSIINQALQVIGVTIIGFSYEFSAGIDTRWYVDLTTDIITGISLDFVSWNFNINKNSDLIFLKINFFPIIILSFIYNQKEKFKKLNERIHNYVSG